MAKSTESRQSRQSAKPYDEFPLFPHASGRWAKKIKGRLHYFGRWAHKRNGVLERVKGDGWREALESYKRQVDDLQAGRTPREDNGDAPTLRDLCNAFLESKQDKMDSGELSPGTFSGYRMATDRLIEHFGKFRRLDDLRPEDFQLFRKTLAKGRGLVTLKNNVNLSRIVIKFAYDHGLVEKPIRYGQAFDKPNRKNLLKERNESGAKLFTRDELLAILAEVEGDPVMKAMVLLALNGGLGNTDLADLPQSVIDWKGGWLNYPRGKTGIERRIPLWKETIESLKAAIDSRRTPKDSADENLCFVSREGHRLVRIVEHKSRAGRFIRRDSLGDRFGKLLKRLGINGRKRLGFYSLRHTFATVASGSKDQIAVDSIMGHSDNSMAGNYRHGIEDERLRDVVNHVHGWLFGEAEVNE